MKYGTLFAYWVHEWKGNYTAFAKRVAKIGFDILEVSAGQLIRMTNKELDDLKEVTKDLGIEVTSNIGPPKKQGCFFEESFN
jgi:D-psicose/D-tagatose/L-ribulose 3-epimerase